MFLRKRIFIFIIFFINDKKFYSPDKYALKSTAKNKISNNLTCNSLCSTRITELFGIDFYRNYSIIS